MSYLLPIFAAKLKKKREISKYLTLNLVNQNIYFTDAKKFVGASGIYRGFPVFERTPV